MIKSVVSDRANLSMTNIYELIKSRLSFVKLFNLYDDVEMNQVKVFAEVTIQNEKLNYMYKKMNELRSPRKETKKKRNHGDSIISKVGINSILDMTDL